MGTLGFDSRITLQKLEIFCLVVELGGIGRAAEQLMVSQPVVTAHMRLLQDRVGAQLLQREGQRMRLTEAGHAVYAWATEVLARGREVAREVAELEGGSAGSAVVAASMSVGSYLLPPILARFRAERPEARLTLHVRDSDDARRAAEIGDCDFAVITTSTADTGGALVAEPLGRHELVLAAAPGDDQVGDAVAVSRLADLRYVCSPSGSPRRGLIGEELARLGVGGRRIVMELGHPEALKTAAADGAGVALLYRASVAAELHRGTLREVRIDGAELSAPVVLLRRPDKRLSPLQEALANAIREALAGTPQAADSARAIAG